MQANFADMVGSSQAITAVRILSGAAHDEVKTEISGLTPALEAANQSQPPITMVICISEDAHAASAMSPSFYVGICIAN